MRILLVFTFANTYIFRIWIIIIVWICNLFGFTVKMILKQDPLDDMDSIGLNFCKLTANIYYHN